jgi:hypothetical protein
VQAPPPIGKVAEEVRRMADAADGLSASLTDCLISAADESDIEECLVVASDSLPQGKGQQGTPPVSLTETHTHTHTHTRARARTRARAHTCALPLTREQSHTSHTHTHTHTHTHAHAHAHARARVRTQFLYATWVLGCASELIGYGCRSSISRRCTGGTDV